METDCWACVKIIIFFIVNGRYKSSASGDLTLRDTSVIDYYLSTVSAYMKIVNFEVKSLDSIFSDGHSVLNCSIMIYNTILNSKQPLPNNNKRPKWNQELQQPFIENIDTTLQTHGVWSTLDIGCDVGDLNTTLYQCRKSDVFPTSNLDVELTLWFGLICNKNVYTFYD